MTEQQRAKWMTAWNGAQVAFEALAELDEETTGPQQFAACLLCSDADRLRRNINTIVSMPSAYDAGKRVFEKLQEHSPRAFTDPKRCGCGGDIDDPRYICCPACRKAAPVPSFRVTCSECPAGVTVFHHEGPKSPGAPAPFECPDCGGKMDGWDDVDGACAPLPPREV